MSLSFKEKIINYQKASYPFLWVETHEENRVIRELFATYKNEKNVKVYTWNMLSGVEVINFESKDVDKVKRVSIKDTDKPNIFLNFVRDIGSEHRHLFIVQDFHPFMEAPGVIRSLRNMEEAMNSKGIMMVFLSPITKIPRELEKSFQFIDFGLPNEEDIKTRLEYIKKSFEKSSNTKIEYTPKFEKDTVEAAKGMTETEIDNAFALAIITHKQFNDDFVGTVFSEKIEKIKKNSLLTYIEPDVKFSDVGGWDGLKQWMITRAKGWLPEAKAFGLPKPKGVLLCGPPGTGKTLIAKATAKEFNVPLFGLDIGALFGKFIGETEQNFRSMIKTVDAIGPCVLFIDEFEKGLHKDAVSGKGDTGTSSRAFTSLLSWMNDRKSSVFIIGTSNNHTILPPELIRKGRFDELFWLGLPGEEERGQIFEVLLKKYGRDPKKFNVKSLAKKSTGFVGAEIEEVIKSALFQVFSSGRADIENSDLITALEETEPQSKACAAEYEEMRNKAEGKLRSANTIIATSQSKALRQLSVS